MKKVLIVLFVLISGQLFGTGEPSTYFNIFVPPNNDAVQRNVCLVITAIYDNTTFEIIDDGMDGDTDDSKSGTLYAGQSYILYIKDNGINDDARYASGGVLKQDGDYFIIKSSNLVYASQSTDSDWQHDWIPSVNKSSLGTKFILYTPKKSTSNRDINVFPYENSTIVTIRKVSLQSTLTSGLTHVNMDTNVVVAQVTLNVGEDIIYRYTQGRDLLVSGETYVIESNKPITVQYGALFGNERDGGGYVPTSNGSSSGQLMYFAVPYQSGGEQEIRIVSWHNNNQIQLDRYYNGAWVSVKSWSLNERRYSEWVGKSNGNVSYPNVFRITCTAGKKVSVFEGNWFETGSPGTSDMATMVCADNGTTSGDYFLTYLAPPGNEQNVLNPFTQTLFGQQITHVYIFAKDTAHVTVRDAYTQGAKLNRSYTILPNRYVDCFLTLAEWKNIYNGTGTPSGPERPYLEISSDRSVSVMNTNFNDNWMMYFGSSQEQKIKQSNSSTGSILSPGDTSTVTSMFQLTQGSIGSNCQITTIVAEGLDVVETELTISGNQEVTMNGQVIISSKDTRVQYNSIPTVTYDDTIIITTTVVAQPVANSGTLIPPNSIQSVETLMSASFGGVLEQSSSPTGISNNSNDLSNYIFSNFQNTSFAQLLTNSWSIAWNDYNNDGWEDFYLPEYSKSKAGLLFRNNGAGSFTSVSNAVTAVRAVQTSSAWVDMDNDGDQDMIITSIGTNKVFRNDNGNFVSVEVDGLTTESGYYHGAIWADYNRDGLLDVFLCNYHPTRYNILFRNDGNFRFTKVEADNFPMMQGKTTGATWCDFNSDGYPDLFVPIRADSATVSSCLFKNKRDGSFEKTQFATPFSNAVANCWGDIDSDGDMDLFISNASNEDNFLYINNGDETFTQSVNVICAIDKGNSHSCSFQDLDNDGDQDLYVSNDSGVKFLYLNDGTGNFTKNSNEIVTGLIGNTISHAFCDWDKDGDLDLGTATHSNQKNPFFLNNGNPNHWISLSLHGSESNKYGIGSRVHLYHNNQQQVLFHFPQSGFGAQHSKMLHFGLGNATIVDSIIVYWPNGNEQKFYSINTNQIVNLYEPTGIEISGTLLEDFDLDCEVDTTEHPITNLVVKINPVNKIITCQSDGSFSTQLPAGNYQMELISNNYRISCDPVVTVGTGNAVHIQKLVRAITNVQDIEVNMTCLAKRRGFRSDNLVTVKNIGTVQMREVRLEFNFPTEVYYMSSSVNSVYSGQKLSVDLGDLQPNESHHIVVNDSVGLSYPINTALKYSAVVSSSDNDWIVDNNTVEMNEIIVGAIDPNEMLSYPIGKGDKHLIKENTRITYKILFQNLGNYLASNVKIINELSPFFDLTTLKIHGSSHDFQSELSNGTLEFSFRNINLPDSSSNEPGSHGYVEYSVLPITNLSEQLILNSAKIYFDYEDPVQTNTVYHYITSNTGSYSVWIYPNPTSGVVDIKVIGDELEPLEDLVQVEYLNTQMQVIKVLHSNGKMMQSDISDLNDGLYFIRLLLSDGTYLIRPLIKIK